MYKVIEDVELWHPRLSRPDSYKGGDLKWSIQLRVFDEDRADALEALGFTVKRIKEDDGTKYWRANVSRKVEKNDGTRREPPMLLDGQLRPLDPKILGNGSKGNVRIYCWEMERDGETLSGRILDKIQVSHLIKYEGGDEEQGEDFKVVSDGEGDDFQEVDY